MWRARGPQACWAASQGAEGTMAPWFQSVICLLWAECCPGGKHAKAVGECRAAGGWFWALWQGKA